MSAHCGRRGRALPCSVRPRAAVQRTAKFKSSVILCDMKQVCGALSEDAPAPDVKHMLCFTIAELHRPLQESWTVDSAPPPHAAAPPSPVTRRAAWDGRRQPQPTISKLTAARALHSPPPSIHRVAQILRVTRPQVFLLLWNSKHLGSCGARGRVARSSALSILGRRRFHLLRGRAPRGARCLIKKTDKFIYAQRGPARLAGRH